MKGRRVMRFVGNRQEPEKELYSFEEVLHNSFSHNFNFPMPLISDSIFSNVDSYLKAHEHIPNPLFSDFEEKIEKDLRSTCSVVLTDKPERGQLFKPLKK